MLQDQEVVVRLVTSRWRRLPMLAIGISTTGRSGGAGLPLRIVWLLPSVTYTKPLASTATPSGELNRAPLPDPSLLPLVPARPPMVVTTPSGVILRMSWLPLSPT